MTSPYEIINANHHELPLIVSMPHSGTWLPATMQAALVPDIILANVDWFLPDLYRFIPDSGITTLINHVHRYVADPNRSVHSLADGSYEQTAVYQRNTFGRPLYTQPLTQDTIQTRMRDYYFPYRHALQALIEAKLTYFDRILVLDMHSFGAYPHDHETPPADVVLGNRRDQTISPALRQFLTTSMRQQGFTVADNHPFAGGAITRDFANDRVATLQIELHYSSYIARRTFGEEELTAPDATVFATTQTKMKVIIEQLVADIKDNESSF